jgi:hypothetical protein
MKWLWTGLNLLNMVYNIGLFEYYNDSSGSKAYAVIYERLPFQTNSVTVLNTFEILTFAKYKRGVHPTKRLYRWNYRSH